MFGFGRNRENRTDWSEFEAEVMPCAADLYRVARWLTKDPAEAEDLVQDTVFQALRFFHTYQKGTRIKSWLVKIMYRLNMKRHQKRSRLPIADDVEGTILESVAFVPPVPQHITDEEILDVLGRLPRQFREVIMLVNVEGFSYSEVAELLQVPIGTVMSRLHRGKKLLRAELADYAEGCGFTALAK